MQPTIPVNQYLYYDPVLGLRYTSSECDFRIEFGEDPIVENMDDNFLTNIIQQWKSQFLRGFVAFQNVTVTPLPRIISNF